MRGIHRPPVNSPHKGQWRGALVFSLIWAWINGWVTNYEAGDLRRHRAHYDVTVMLWICCSLLRWSISHKLCCWFGFASFDGHIDGLVQDCSISSALVMEILQPCTKPSIWAFCWRFWGCTQPHTLLRWCSGSYAPKVQGECPWKYGIYFTKLYTCINDNAFKALHCMIKNIPIDMPIPKTSGPSQFDTVMYTVLIWLTTRIILWIPCFNYLQQVLKCG